MGVRSRSIVGLKAQQEERESEAAAGKKNRGRDRCQKNGAAKGNRSMDCDPDGACFTEGYARASKQR